MSAEDILSKMAVTSQLIPTVRMKFNHRCRPLVDDQDYGSAASFCHAQQTDKGNNNVVCYSRLLSAEFNLSPQELHSETNSNIPLDNVIHIHSLTNPLAH